MFVFFQAGANFELLKWHRLLDTYVCVVYVTRFFRIVLCARGV